MSNKNLICCSSAKLADKSSKRGLLLLILVLCSIHLNAQFPIYYHLAEKDSIFVIDGLKLQNKFQSALDADDYIRRLPDILNKKGYVTASVDSISMDSTAAHV